MAIFNCGQKIKINFDQRWRSKYFNLQDYENLKILENLIVLDDCNKFMVSKQTGFSNIIWIEVLTDKGILILDRSLPYLISKFNIEYDKYNTIIHSGKSLTVFPTYSSHHSRSLDFGLENYISRVYMKTDDSLSGIPIKFDLPIYSWNNNENLITNAINVGMENYGKIHS